MIVVCCPANLWPATKDALAEHAPSAFTIPIPAEDISQPWKTYARLWGGDDLVIIEQDVIIHDTVLTQFGACPEPWCIFPGRHYAQGGGWMKTGLLCNRFRTEFMQAVSVEAIEAVYGSCTRCHGRNPRCWAHLDGKIRQAGEDAGYQIHVHWPSVGHRDSQPGEYENPP